MKRASYVIAAVGVATILIAPCNVMAGQPNSLDRLLGDTNLDFFTCSTLLDTAEAITDTPGYGPNSPKTKDAYKKFYVFRDAAAANGERRFAAIKQEFASKASAETALKDLYIYWRAEIAPCVAHKKADVVTNKFRLLLERVRVEASW